MLISDLFEMEGEVVSHDTSMASKLAKQLIRATQSKLYKGGKKPSLVAVKKAVDTATKRLYSDVLRAVDVELGAEKEKVIN